MARRQHRVVIVGAGSAGCAVASVLATDPSIAVTVLEAGDAVEPTSLDLFKACATPGRTWPGLMARRTPESEPTPYIRGRGLGGTGAINGGVWGISLDPEGWFQYARIPLSSANYRIRTREQRGRATHHYAETVDRYLIASRERLSAPPLAIQSASAMLALRPSLPENITYLRGAQVDRVLSSPRVEAVLLTDGRTIDADVVIVSAGALFSPGVLVRSGVDRPGVGKNLHDHHGFGISFALPEPGDPEEPLTRMYFELTSQQNDPIHVFGINRTGTDAAGLSTGAIFAVPMVHHGRGEVVPHTQNAHSMPNITFDTIPDERDTRNREQALALISQFADDLRTEPSPSETTPSVPYDAPIYHAAGTCRVGTPDDDMAVVDDRCRVIDYDNLYVVDASIFPSQPPVNPELPTIVLAEVVASRIAASLG